MNSSTRTKKIFSILKQTLLFCAPFILITFISFKNIFPQGYTYNNGDVFQYTNLSILLKNLSFTWIRDSGGYFLQYTSYSLYYIALFLWQQIISPNLDSFFFIFTFLSLSYISFYATTTIFNNQISTFKKIFFSLIYAINPYTLYIFTYSWGWTPFLFLYILTPLIFILSYKYLLTDKTLNKHIFALTITFFFSNIAFGNMPFAVSLVMILFLFLALIKLFYKIPLKTFLLKAFLIFASFSLACFWSIAPQIIEMLRLASNANIGQISNTWDNQAWFLWQRASFPNIFFLNVGSNLNLFIGKIQIIGFLFISAITYFFTVKKKQYKLGTIFLIVTLFISFLANKGKGIFEDTTVLKYLYNTLTMSIRSYDKTFVFLIFFLLFISVIYHKHIKNKHLIVASILIFLSAFPFFTGGIQTKYNYNALDQNKDYLESKYSGINKIPQEYQDIANQINKEELEKKILHAPYSVINSIGWENYPKWKLVGVDPIKQYFKDPHLYMNSFNVLGVWNYGETWNDQNNINSQWILDFASMLNTKYLIYHKDVEGNFIGKTENKIKFYRDSGVLTEVSSNDYFELLEIPSNKFLPLFYTPTQIIVSDQETKETPYIIRNNQETERLLIYFENQNKNKEIIELGSNDSLITEFKKINPTKHRVRIHNTKESFPLIFSESFHSGWKLYQNNINSSSSQASFQGSDFISENIKGTIQNNNLPNNNFHETWLKKAVVPENQHLVANTYANSWIINPREICQQENSQCYQNEDGTWNLELIVEFWPQRLYYLGIFISLGTLFVATALLIISFIRDNKNSINHEHKP